MNTKITVDGTPRLVKHWFSTDRAIVDLDGFPVFVDRNDNTGWELSGKTAGPDERAIFESLAGPDRTEVTATIPDLPVDDIIPGDDDSGAPGGDPGGFM